MNDLYSNVCCLFVCLFVYGTHFLSFQRHCRCCKEIRVVSATVAHASEAVFTDETVDIGDRGEVDLIADILVHSPKLLFSSFF